MKISLDELRALPQPRLQLDFSEKLEGTEAVKPVVGELTVTAGLTGMHLSGRVQTLLKLQCDRCLRPYFQNITVDIDERFVINGLFDDGQAVRKENELSRAEHFVETLDDDGLLDITDIVYQAVTLSTPTSCLCGDECAGLPLPDKLGQNVSLGKAKVGRKNDDPIDPRWKNLKTLFPNEDRETKS